MHRMKNFSFSGKIMSPKIPIWVSYDPFTLKKTCGMQLSSRQNFVLKKNDLHRLAEALQITGTLKCYQGTVFLVWYWNNSREILACNNNNNGNNFISVFPRSYMVLPTIHFEYITKARKKNRSTIYVEGEMCAVTAKGAYGKLSNRWCRHKITTDVQKEKENLKTQNLKSHLRFYTKNNRNGYR